MDLTINQGRRSLKEVTSAIQDVTRLLKEGDNLKGVRGAY